MPPPSPRLGASALLLALCAALSPSAQSPSNAAPRPDDARDSTLAGRPVESLEGHRYHLGGRSGDRPFALIFVTAGCPISNRSIPELNAVTTRARAAGVELFLIYADPYGDAAEARAHHARFAITPVGVFDGSNALARALDPTHVPECFVFSKGARLTYRGAIDDSFAAVGRPRAVTRNRYLADAIEAAIAGRAPARASTPPVGCVYRPRSVDETLESANYERDVAPILANHCGACHRLGGAAPLELWSYEQAAANAAAISSETHARRMPPRPQAGPSVTLTDLRSPSSFERRLLAHWAAAGAPRGEARDRTPRGSQQRDQRASEVERLPAPGSVVVAPSATPRFEILEVPLGGHEGRALTAARYRSSTPERHRETALSLFPEGPSGPRVSLGYSHDDAPIRPFAAGAAIRLGPRSVLRLEIGYHPSSSVTPDAGAIELSFVERPSPRRHALPLSAAGSEAGLLPIEQAVTLRAFTASLSPPARGLELILRRARGSPRTLLRVERAAELLNAPFELGGRLDLRAGDQLELRAIGGGRVDALLGLERGSR